MKKRILSIISATALLLITLSSCASMKYGFSDSDVVKPSKRGYIPVTSYIGDGMLTFSPDSDGYVFELYAHDGSFYTSVENEEDSSSHADFVKEITIEGEGYAYWTSVEESNTVEWFNDDRTYIEILIKKDGQYVGYAIARVEKTDADSSHYLAEILECKETAVEKAREKGFTHEQLQKCIDDTIKNAEE